MLAKRRIVVGLLTCSAALGVLMGLAHMPAATLPNEAGTPHSADPFKHGKWPFYPPVRPAAPEVRDKAWVRNAIDAFVLHALEAKGLAPNGEAEKLALLRRVTFDLTGLPPTPEEQTAFVADNSTDAYEKVVDRLLASPRYGERWAQHWLDVVRYAETDGFKEDAQRPNAYKYRDYVIRSLNADLPYDRFIRQQLAGDELEPDNPDAIAATGYCRLYPDEYNAADVHQRRQEILDDVTDATGLVFLGLTMGCAQCHNHKFDEILQTDYYRLQAFFTPMLPREDLSEATRSQREEFAKKQVAWEKSTAAIRVDIEKLIGPVRQKLHDEALEKFNADIAKAFRTFPSERTAEQQQLAFQVAKYVRTIEAGAVGKLSPEKKKQYDELETKLAKFDSLKPAPLPTLMAVTDAVGPPPPTFLLKGGSLKQPGDSVEPGFPTFLGAAQPEIAPVTIAATGGGERNEFRSTGRRAALAEWLTRSDHPLTARIMVNRLWQYHFGQGIVATPNDFGAAGEPPTHPELLDWLAVEFMDSGWSLKAMHRMMVTSATYRQSALVDPKSEMHTKAAAADPSNKLLWHARRQRLTGEALRDAVLEVAGDLNLRMYGPSAHPELPDGIGNHAWKPDANPEDRNRRSIYVLAKRNLRLPLLEAFDLPDMHNSCPRRSTTTTAPQALLMLNSEFALGEARHWAGQLLQSSSDKPTDDRALISTAYVQAYGRQPTASEFDMCAKFISDQAAAVDDSKKLGKESLPDPMPKSAEPARGAAIVDFCHAILNSNEFMYVD